MCEILDRLSGRNRNGATCSIKKTIASIAKSMKSKKINRVAVSISFRFADSPDSWNLGIPSLDDLRFFRSFLERKKTMRNTRSHSVALIISESPICDKEICNQPTQCWFCWSLKHQTLFMMALVLFFLNWIIREPEASSIRMKFFLVKNGSWCWPIQTSSLQKNPSKLSLNWFFFHYKHADQIRWLKKPKELLATL